MTEKSAREISKERFEAWAKTQGLLRDGALRVPDYSLDDVFEAWQAAERDMAERAAKGILKKYDGYDEAPIIAKYIRSLANG